MKFDDFVKIWNLVILWNLKSLNPSEISKFEILNPRHTKFPILETTFLNFGDFCYKFEENFAENWQNWDPYL